MSEKQVIDPDEALRAQLEATLDALTALVRGLQIRDGKRVVATYEKIVDDKAHMTAEQQAAIDLAHAVLAENGR